MAVFKLIIQIFQLNWRDKGSRIKTEKKKLKELNLNLLLIFVTTFTIAIFHSNVNAKDKPKNVLQVVFNKTRYFVYRGINETTYPNIPNSKTVDYWSEKNSLKNKFASVPDFRFEDSDSYTAVKKFNSNEWGNFNSRRVSNCDTIMGCYTLDTYACGNILKSINNPTQLYACEDQMGRILKNTSLLVTSTNDSEELAKFQTHLKSDKIKLFKPIPMIDPKLKQIKSIIKIYENCQILMQSNDSSSDLPDEIETQKRNLKRNAENQM